MTEQLELTLIAKEPKEIKSLDTYRGRRKAAKAKLATTTRAALLSGEAPIAKMLSSGHDPVYVSQVEQVVEHGLEIIHKVADALGIEARVSARRDWTLRTANAKSPRSRGGSYKGAFRGIDDEDQTNHGAGISLRLARAPRDLIGEATWNEYSPIAKHPFIGSIKTNGLGYVLALTLHEGAHALAYAATLKDDTTEAVLEMAKNWKECGNYIPVSNKAHPIWGGHELVWQAIYFTLKFSAGIPGGDIVWNKSESPFPKAEHHLPKGSCAHCGGGFEVALQTKRVQKYCSNSCRVAAYRARVALGA